MTALTNGNYIVASPNWANGALATAGALTFGDGTKGVLGAVSAANSVLGGAANSGLSSKVAVDNVNKTFFGQFYSEGRVRAGSQINGFANPWENVLKPKPSSSHSWRRRGAGLNLPSSSARAMNTTSSPQYRIAGPTPRPPANKIHRLSGRCSVTETLLLGEAKSTDWKCW